jgi:hypothetical protein
VAAVIADQLGGDDGPAQQRGQAHPPARTPAHVSILAVATR